MTKHSKANEIHAHGDWVLIQLPTRLTETEGGIILPEKSAQDYFYGRVISAGPLATVQVNDIVLYNSGGKTDVRYDSMSRAAEHDGFVAVCSEQVICSISEEFARLKGLRIPDPVAVV